MTTIDRRRFVASLGAAAATPALTSASADPHRAAVQVRFPHESPAAGVCFLARHVRAELPDAGVDFWSRPVCDIAHDRYLPPEIARGTIWHEPCAGPDALATIDAAGKTARREYTHQFAAAMAASLVVIHLERRGLDGGERA